MSMCHCGSDVSFNQCCRPILNGESKVATAEALMRARYSAFVEQNFDFLKETLDPTTREGYDEENVRQWATSSEWHGLTIVRTEAGLEDDCEGLVEFVAHYAINGELKEHREAAKFVKREGLWYFWEGEWVKQEPVRVVKIGRNDPCSCGSGKKYKKCCA